MDSQSSDDQRKKWLFFLLLALLLEIISGCSQQHLRQAQQAQLAQTRLQLGLLYLAQGQLTLAGENLQKAVSLAPRDIYNQLAMAMYQQRLGDRLAAKQRFNRLLAQYPDNSLIKGKFAQYWCEQAAYSRAQQQFRQAITIAKRQVRYQQMTNWLAQSGWCFFKAGQLQQAKAQIRQAYRLMPQAEEKLLAKLAELIKQRKRAKAQLLMEIYPRLFSVENVQWVWLNIRFAALTAQQQQLLYYAKWLTQRYPQSEQYRRYLAHEY